jgi:hypothetical protein
MIAKRIKFINVQSPLVGRVKAFVHLDIEDLESQPLRRTDLVRFRGNLDLELRHKLRG